MLQRGRTTGTTKETSDDGDGGECENIRRRNTISMTVAYMWGDKHRGIGQENVDDVPLSRTATEALMDKTLYL